MSDDVFKLEKATLATIQRERAARMIAATQLGVMRHEYLKKEGDLLGGIAASERREREIAIGVARGLGLDPDEVDFDIDLIAGVLTVVRRGK